MNRRTALVPFLILFLGCATEPVERFVIEGSTVTESGVARGDVDVEAWRLARSSEEEDQWLGGTVSDGSGSFRLEADVPDPEAWSLDCTVVRLRIVTSGSPLWWPLTAAESTGLCTSRSLDGVRIVVP